ncbi:MAG: AAA family ATPase [Bdellovibrionales bacterium]|nr:AAA family ATPase [Bdellovibrionales bacterium]
MDFNKANADRLLEQIRNRSNQVKEEKSFQYNEGQTKALEGLVKWALDKNPDDDRDYFATLIGYAGTGKTFITLQLIKELKKNKIWGITVTAPTHKAKKIIAKVTEEDAATIQGILGLRPDTDIDNFNPNSPEFTQQGEILMRYARVLIIDESSMLNKELYKLIIECAIKYKTKVLFIGDAKQINPVNEAISPVFNDVKNIYELTEIVRQKDTNPIAELLNVLRLDIDDSTSSYMEYLQQNPSQYNDKGEGYEVITDHKEFLNRYLEHLASEEYKEDQDYVKYTAWTNDSINGFNKQVRLKVFKEDAINPLFEGEILMGYKMVNRNKDVIILNSEDYIIKSVKPITNVYSIRGYDVNIESETGRQENIFIVGKEGYNQFIVEYNTKLSIAKAKKGHAWVEYYKFKNQNLLIENLYDNQKKLICNKDLDYAYGVSVHKCQGSTYNTIFVNGGNLNRNSNKIEKLRLWYVALSRCSKKAVILL